MGLDVFANWSNNPDCFIIKNIATPKKTIKIFNYPINSGDTRDLIKIPGISESSIRASLLKGELNHKILANEITIICSDIDLLQFNMVQRALLTRAGVISGTTITSDETSGTFSSNNNNNNNSISYLWKEGIIPIGTKNSINRIFLTPDHFIDGVYNGNIFHIDIYHNGRKLVYNLDFKISLTGTGIDFNTINFSSFIPCANSQITVAYAIRNQ